MTLWKRQNVRIADPMTYMLRLQQQMMEKPFTNVPIVMNTHMKILQD